MQHIILNKKLNSLLGFAIKSREVDFGFEAVRRSIQKKKIAIVLVKESIAEDTGRKIQNLANKNNLPILKIDSNDTVQDNISVYPYKIIGIRKGGVAKGFMQNLNWESK